MEDYYKLIDIDQKASAEEIKKRCQELLLKYHPDKQESGSTNETSIFLKIQEARKLLLDTEERKEYDRKLKEKELESFHRPIYSQINIDELDFDEDSNEYYTECRCGGIYVFPDEDLNGKNIVYIPCDNCTYYLEVINNPQP